MLKNTSDPERAGLSIYRAAGTVLVRTPLLPVESLMGMEGGEDADVHAVLNSRDKIPTLALAVGSDSLSQSYLKSLSSQRMPEKVRHKVIRFINRMCSRPTPFGIFAGVALAELSPNTSVELSGEVVRSTRLDMGWLSGFIARTKSTPEIYKHLTYVVNPLIRFGGGRAYLETEEMGKQKGEGSEVSIRLTGVVNAVLTETRLPTGYERLVEMLLTHSGATPEKAGRLIESLWEQGFILDDLSPPVTCADPGNALANRLATIPGVIPERERLRELLLQVKQFDDASPSEAINLLASAQHGAKLINEKHARDCFQTDSANLLTSSCLSQRVGEDVATLTENLLRLTSFPSGTPQLTAYRKRFEEKFSIGQEVLLHDLLDPDIGLGTIDDTQEASGSLTSVLRRDRLLLDLATRALWQRDLEIVLDEAKIAGLTTWEPKITNAPRSLDVIVAIAAETADDIDEGRYSIIVSQNVGAPAAGKYVARFARLLGSEAVAFLSELARREEEVDAETITAELLFEPLQPRIANVIIRPFCRRYYVPVGVHAGPLDGELIPLHEIVVGVKNGRLYMRWVRSTKELRLSNLHMLNHSLSNSVCRLLSEIGRDGVPQLMGFDWGPAASFPFLPRVRIGKAVLRPAEWKIRSGELSKDLNPDQSLFESAFRAYREAWKVPRFVFLVEADNRLLLDLERSECIEDLRSEVKRLARGTPFIMLQEALPAPNDNWVSGPGGKYYSEIVVSVVRNEQANKRVGEGRGPFVASLTTTVPSSPQQISLQDRIKPPGSEWLYVKLYISRKATSHLISHELPAVADRLVDAGLVSRWFFIQYTDPAPHLRLRMKLVTAANTTEALLRLTAWAGLLLEQGLVKRFSFDTYEREIERYGGLMGMDIAEEVFWVDSQAVVRYHVHSAQSDLDLTDTAVLSLNSVLAGLGLSRSERIDFLLSVPQTRLESGDEFRVRRQRLLPLIRKQEYGDDEELIGDEIIGLRNWYASCLLKAQQAIRRMATVGELTTELPSLWGSLAHMHCNRVLGTDQTLERLTIGLLARCLDSVSNWTPPAQGGIGSSTAKSH